MKDLAAFDLSDVNDLTEFMEQAIPFNRLMGLQIAEAHPDGVVLRLPFREEFVGDPIRPALHGGVLSMLIDTAGGCATFLAQTRGSRASTVDLLVDYLLPAPLQDLEATARVVRKGNRVCVAQVAVRSVGSDEVLALGRAVYNVIPV